MSNQIKHTDDLIGVSEFIRKGDPVSPVVVSIDGNQKAVNVGMSKREYFAAMAMQGFSTLEHVSPELAAKNAVAYADALIRELKNATTK